MPQQHRHVGSALTLAVSLQAAAGVVHLVLAPEHLAAATGTGLFFLAYGVFQIVASAFAWRLTPSWQALGLVGSLAGIGLWVLTRWWSDPFTGSVEPVDLLGAATTSLELVAAVGFAVTLFGAPQRRPSWMVAAILVGLISGPSVYALGAGFGAAFPSLSEGQGHEHSNGHDHQHAVAPEATGVDAPSPVAQADDNFDIALRRCSFAVAWLQPNACAKALEAARLPVSK